MIFHMVHSFSAGPATCYPKAFKWGVTSGTCYSTDPLISHIIFFSHSTPLLLILVGSAVTLLILRSMSQVATTTIKTSPSVIFHEYDQHGSRNRINNVPIGCYQRCPDVRIHCCTWSTSHNGKSRPPRMPQSLSFGVSLTSLSHGWSWNTQHPIMSPLHWPSHSWKATVLHALQPALMETIRRARQPIGHRIQWSIHAICSLNLTSPEIELR